MPYPVIASRRIPYDIDGTIVGYNMSNQVVGGITNWISEEIINSINSLNNGSKNLQSFLGQGTGKVLWFFFSEKIEIEQLFNIVVATYEDNVTGITAVQGSNDTTNGLDGTWETANFPNGIPTYSYKNSSILPVDKWRTDVKAISFSTSYKTIRIIIGGHSSGFSIYSIHLYGRKASGETQDDILICDTNGNELTALMDWGDRPEGTTLIKSFKVKNASTTKIANNVNLQLNHADFLLSFDQVTWQATLDIASIPANSLSAEIFVKNPLGPPLLTLGPKAARVIATVGSFT